MAQRFFPPAAPGSLLKGAQSSKPDKIAKTSSPERRGTSTKAPLGKQKTAARERNEAHLAAIRKTPCLHCGAEPCEAAHVRMSAPGKAITGMGIKPSDHFTVPLCHAAHMHQHSIGEKAFWAELGIDPLLVAAALYAVSPDLVKMRAVALEVIDAKNSWREMGVDDDRKT